MTLSPPTCPDDAVPVGLWQGVTVEVAPRDAVTAEVSLSIAGMFTRELLQDAPTGGLHHLDHALGGAITRLRALGIFRAAVGETLTLSDPAAPILARTVLAIGLGDPTEWTPQVMTAVVATAVREAIRLEGPSAAFSPSLLDSGLRPAALVGAPDAMLAGLFDAIPRDGPPPAELNRWVFCAGANHLEQVAGTFRRAFVSLGGL